MNLTVEGILGIIEAEMLNQEKVEHQSRNDKMRELEHTMAMAKSATLRDLLERFQYKDYGAATAQP